MVRRKQSKPQQDVGPPEKRSAPDLPDLFSSSESDAVHIDEPISPAQEDTEDFTPRKRRRSPARFFWEEQAVPLHTLAALHSEMVVLPAAVLPVSMPAELPLLDTMDCVAGYWLLVKYRPKKHVMHVTKTYLWRGAQCKGYIDIPGMVLHRMRHMVEVGAAMLIHSFQDDVDCNPGADTGDVDALKFQLGILPAAFSDQTGLHLDLVIAWLQHVSPMTLPLAIPFGDHPRHKKELWGIAKQCRPLDPARVYDHVQLSGQEPALIAELPELRPQLRPYQLRAAAWMVQREKSLQNDQAQLRLPRLWQKLELPDPSGNQQTVYYHPGQQIVSKERPYKSMDEMPVKGGILADEMGMGKTVELLACMLAHPFPGARLPAELAHAEPRSRGERIDCVCGATDENTNSHKRELWVQCDACEAWLHGACIGYPKRAPTGEYVCRPCTRHAASMRVQADCGATLIVCPDSILPQWQSEIARHTYPGAIRVVVYEGQSQSLKSSAAVSAAQLAAADVVLTSYDVLRRDLHHEPEEQANSYSFRFHRKYEVIPTPLTRLRWWRVCLDEAQMLKSNQSEVTSMAGKLEAVHRWAVTGTPLSHDARDLLGLLRFLRAPDDLLDAWPHLCQGNEHAQMLALNALPPATGGLLWRNSKANVAEELGLPPQSHKVSRLQMSPVERHFYARQHQDCVTAAQRTLPASLLAASRAHARAAPDGDSEVSIAPAEGSAEELDRQLTVNEVKKVWLPLLRLRQACCHPQVGAGGIKSLQHAKAPLTMGEILEVLLAKAKNEAEDAQRLLLGALNGLAALMLVDAQPAEAVNLYRQVLKTAQANDEWIKSDPLQRFHTLHNLAQLIGRAGGSTLPGVARTLRDERLATEASVISQEYMAQWTARMAAAEADYRSSAEASSKIIEQHQSSGSSSSSARLRGGAAAAQHFGPWLAEAIDILQMYSTDRGARAADALREQLLERDQYRQPSGQNATGLARRFSSLAGLKLILVQELEAIQATRAGALEPLDELACACTPPSDQLVQSAGRCGRCRAELGESGQVCRHCRLDERWLAWEMRLYSVHTRALVAGTAVSAEDALRQAQAAALRRVGQGGLGEAAGEVDGEAAGASGSALLANDDPRTRNDNLVSGTEVLRQPSEAEQTIRLLVGQLRLMKGLPSSDIVARRDAAMEAGRAMLEWLEAERKLLVKGRAFALAQRALLYAADELAMACMRLRVRLPGESVLLHEAHFKLHEAEVPMKNKELTIDRIAAEADLNRTLGTLRYLTGLRAAQTQQLQATPASPRTPKSQPPSTQLAPAGSPATQQTAKTPSPDPTADQPGPSAATTRTETAEPAVAAPHLHNSATHAEFEDEEGGDKDGLHCPVCHDVLGQELMMLTCGHQLCCRCCMTLIERLPAFPPQARNKISCPTCRHRVPVAEVALVRSEGLEEEDAKAGQDLKDYQEAQLHVEGSYGTKIESVVRRIKHLTADASNKVLVFSTWQDVLEVVAHALHSNRLPYAYARGRKAMDSAISQFKAAAPVGGSKDSSNIQSKPLQVLLLLVKQGGNGLNLTEAQHVILVEPLLDPAVEAQVVGRVHRIGQTRPTVVHRLIMDASIEENVCQINSERAATMDLSAAAAKQAPKAEQQSLSIRDVGKLLQQHWASASEGATSTIVTASVPS